MGLQEIYKKEQFIQDLNKKRGMDKQMDSGVVVNHRTQVKKMEQFKREK